MNDKILLESGTGEFELLEFQINNRSYAINIIKVKEIIEIDSKNITKLPESHPAVAGLILNRNEITTLVDLKYVLDKEYKTENKFKAMICEFNKIKVAFILDNVTGVRRINWKDILKPDDISVNSLAIGNIILNNKIIMMLDFEKLVTDISPSTGISENRITNIEMKDRSKIRLVIADDSPLISKLLKDTLTKAGLQHITMFENGEEALEYLEDISNKKGDNFVEDAHILITDIEMPQMDGFTLTRRIKEHHILKRLPVIIFSSLITDELKHKGESVGADGQLSKPDIDELVEMVDSFSLELSI